MSGRRSNTSIPRLQVKLLPWTGPHVSSDHRLTPDPDSGQQNGRLPNTTSLLSRTLPTCRSTTKVVAGLDTTQVERVVWERRLRRHERDKNTIKGGRPGSLFAHTQVFVPPASTWSTRTGGVRPDLSGTFGSSTGWTRDGHVFGQGCLSEVTVGWDERSTFDPLSSFPSKMDEWGEQARSVTGVQMSACVT